MKIVFISGVKMGFDCAEALLKEEYNIAAIFSLPETCSSCSGYVDFAPLGKKYNIPVFEYKDTNDPQVVKKVKELAPDLILVIGWSGVISEELLTIPKKGVLGHHPTLLPKHRGNAPIPWTLINGLTKSGVTLFFLEKEIDKGDIAGRREFEVIFEDDASTLYKKATKATILLLSDVLPKIEHETLIRTKQDPAKASRWSKRRPEDGIIDWNCMTIYLYNWIRGLTHPYPGAFTFLGRKKLYLWKVKIAEVPVKKSRCGELFFLDGGPLVRTGNGAIELLRLQLEGEEEMDAAEFVKRHAFKEGVVLG